MTERLDLDEGEETARDEIRVRCSSALKRQMEGLAKAETRAREIRGRHGKVSVNRLMKFVIERYIADWVAERKVDAPKSEDDVDAVERAARAINAQREKAARSKT